MTTHQSPTTDRPRRVVEAERTGADCRQLTPRTIGGLWQWIEAGKPFYISSDTTAYGPDGTPPGRAVDGLSVYNLRTEDDKDRRHVARFGDWIVRRADGTWGVIQAEPAVPVADNGPAHTALVDAHAVLGSTS